MGLEVAHGNFVCDEAGLLLLCSLSRRTDAALQGLLKQQAPRRGAVI